MRPAGSLNTKLLEGKGKGKSKQASLSSQQQAASAANTPAMRQHATASISQALQDDSAFHLRDDELKKKIKKQVGIWNLPGQQQQSAYLNALANAEPHRPRGHRVWRSLTVPSEPNQARHLGRKGHHVSLTGAQSS